MKELLTALVAAKATFKPIPKDKINPFHKSKYASLDAVLGAVEPSLLLNGLTLSHSVSDGKLTTRLYHTSGDFLESSFNLPELSDPQKLGSQISYYRRYAVCGLLSVTADEDDDGNAAKPQNGAATAAKKPGDGAIASPAKIASPPPIKTVAPLYSEDIKTRQQALRECCEILDWTPEYKADWIKTISPIPISKWDVTVYDLAVVKALAAIDQLNSGDESGWAENADKPVFAEVV